MRAATRYLTVADEERSSTGLRHCMFHTGLTDAHELIHDIVSLKISSEIHARLSSLARQCSYARLRNVFACKILSTHGDG